MSAAWGARGRLWNLLDMINCNIGALVSAMDVLRNQIKRYETFQSDGINGGYTNDASREALKNNVDFVVRECRRLNLDKSEARIQRLMSVILLPSTFENTANQLKALLDAIEDDIKTERFYHYPKNKGMLTLTFEADWSKTIQAFPTAKLEIFDAVDCFGLGHPTAAVFHLMRVAEYGLRALARERKVTLPKNKPIEWGTWQEILNKIDEGINGRIGIAKTAKAGPVKDEALAFYNGALGHFLFFKDMYRNMVMHARQRYDELQAEIALNHVREFMNGLSLRINETSRPIRWRF